VVKCAFSLFLTQYLEIWKNSKSGIFQTQTIDQWQESLRNVKRQAEESGADEPETTATSSEWNDVILTESSGLEGEETDAQVCNFCIVIFSVMISLFVQQKCLESVSVECPSTLSRAHLLGCYSLSLICRRLGPPLEVHLSAFYFLHHWFMSHTDVDTDLLDLTIGRFVTAVVSKSKTKSSDDSKDEAQSEKIMLPGSLFANDDAASSTHSMTDTPDPQKQMKTTSPWSAKADHEQTAETEDQQKHEPAPVARKVNFMHIATASFILSMKANCETYRLITLAHIVDNVVNAVAEWTNLDEITLTNLKKSIENSAQFKKACFEVEKDMLQMMGFDVGPALRTAAITNYDLASDKRVHDFTDACEWLNLGKDAADRTYENFKNPTYLYCPASALAEQEVAMFAVILSSSGGKFRKFPNNSDKYKHVNMEAVKHLAAEFSHFRSWLKSQANELADMPIVLKAAANVRKIRRSSSSSTPTPASDMSPAAGSSDSLLAVPAQPGQLGPGDTVATPEADPSAGTVDIPFCGPCEESLTDVSFTAEFPISSVPHQANQLAALVSTGNQMAVAPMLGAGPHDNPHHHSGKSRSQDPPRRAESRDRRDDAPRVAYRHVGDDRGGHERDNSNSNRSRENCAVFVSRFPAKARDRELEDIFSKYGVITHFDRKPSSGFCVITYSHRREAEDALRLNGVTVFEFPLIVRPYVPKEQRRDSMDEAPRGRSPGREGSRDRHQGQQRNDSRERSTHRDYQEQRRGDSRDKHDRLDRRRDDSRDRRDARFRDDEPSHYNQSSRYDEQPLSAVCVSGFPQDMSDLELGRMFESCGDVRSLDRRSRNCMIYFSSARAADSAVSAFDRYRFSNGCVMSVEISRERREDSSNTRGQCLFVAGFDPMTITENDIRQVFSKYGEIASIRRRGLAPFCHVFFKDSKDARNALTGCNGARMRDGKHLRLEISDQQPDHHGFDSAPETSNRSTTSCIPNQASSSAPASSAENNRDHAGLGTDDQEPADCVFVNFDGNVRDSEIYDIFAKIGAIRVFHRKPENRYCHIYFQDPKAVDTAVKELNGFRLADGTQLRLELSRNRSRSRSRSMSHDAGSLETSKTRQDNTTKVSTASDPGPVDVKGLIEARSKSASAAPEISSAAMNVEHPAAPVPADTRAEKRPRDEQSHTRNSEDRNSSREHNHRLYRAFVDGLPPDIGTDQLRNKFVSANDCTILRSRHGAKAFLRFADGESLNSALRCDRETWRVSNTTIQLKVVDASLCRSIFVGDFAGDTRDRELADLFSQAGDIAGFERKGYNRFCHIDYRRCEDIERAFAMFENYELRGSRLRLDISTNRGSHYRPTTNVESTSTVAPAEDQQANKKAKVLDKAAHDDGYLDRLDQAGRADRADRRDRQDPGSYRVFVSDLPAGTREYELLDKFTSRQGYQPTRCKLIHASKTEVKAFICFANRDDLSSALRLHGESWRVCDQNVRLNVVDISDCNSVTVKHFSHDTHDDVLYNLFARAGKIARLTRDGPTRCHIEFVNPEDIERAVVMFDEYKMSGGCVLRVSCGQTPVHANSLSSAATADAKNSDAGRVDNKLYRAFVDDLPASITEDQLLRLFNAKKSTVPLSCQLYTHATANSSKAFVRFRNETALKAALAMNGTTYKFAGSADSGSKSSSTQTHTWRITDISKSHSLVVDNFSSATSIAEIRAAFESCGEVVHVSKPAPTASSSSSSSDGANTKFGVTIEFKDSASLEAALRLNNFTLQDGSQLRVDCKLRASLAKEITTGTSKDTTTTTTSSSSSSTLHNNNINSNSNSRDVSTRDKAPSVSVSVTVDDECEVDYESADDIEEGEIMGSDLPLGGGGSAMEEGELPAADNGASSSSSSSANNKQPPVYRVLISDLPAIAPQVTGDELVAAYETCAPTSCVMTAHGTAAVMRLPNEESLRQALSTHNTTQSIGSHTDVRLKVTDASKYCNLFVGDFSAATSNTELQEVFGKCGAIDRLVRMNSEQHGHVNFRSPESFEAALELNGSKMKDGSVIRVEISRQPYRGANVPSRVASQVGVSPRTSIMSRISRPSHASANVGSRAGSPQKYGHNSIDHNYDNNSRRYDNVGFGGGGGGKRKASEGQFVQSAASEQQTLNSQFQQQWQDQQRGRSSNETKRHYNRNY
jgi:RNA recognition motif-containing protein